MTKRLSRLPSGFEYRYRPDSYFVDLDPRTLILASIHGEERRKDVQRRLDTGGFDPLVWGEWLTDAQLDDSTRRLIGAMHPALMGGEYLPPTGEHEIEIARIVLASVTQDVTSIRARRSGKRIVYRVVDEYGTKFKLGKRWSSAPLTLKELIRLIDGTNQDDGDGGLVFSTLRMNIGASGDAEGMRDFVAVESSLYPDLSNYYDETINGYLDGLIAEECEAEEE